MSEALRIRKNSLYSTLSITSRLIANVFVFWIMARYYGPETFGQFTSAQILAANFILFADFGFDILLTTEVAKNKKDAQRLFQQFFSLKIIFCIIALISMWVLALFGNFSPETRTLISIFSFYTVVTTLTNFLYGLYKGFEQLEYETKVSMFVNVGLLIIAFPLIILKVNVLWIAAAFIVTRIMGFIIGIHYSHKLIPKISFTLLFDGFHEIKSKVFVFGFFLLFNNLFFQLDTILLSLWKGDREVGVYQSVFKLIMLPLVVPDIFINTLMPVLSRFNVENQAQWKRIGYLMNKILTAIVIPVSIILFVYSEQIIKIIYGLNNYSNAVPILKIFAVTLFVRFSLEAYALLLTTSDRQAIRLYTVVAATILNFSINYYLIPIYGAFGAAIVSLITNVFVGIVYYSVNLKLVYEYLFNLKTFVMVLSSIVIALIFWFNKSMNVFVSGPIILMLFLFLTLFFYFTKEEKKIIFSNEFRFSLIGKKN